MLDTIQKVFKMTQESGQHKGCVLVVAANTWATFTLQGFMLSSDFLPKSNFCVCVYVAVDHRHQTVSSLRP